MRLSRQRFPRHVLLVLAAASALAAGACSSGSSSSSAPAAAAQTSNVPSSASTGTGRVKNVATGAPIVFGYVNDDSGAAAAFPDETGGTKATVAYINNYLGGVNGHPIQ